MSKPFQAPISFRMAEEAPSSSLPAPARSEGRPAGRARASDTAAELLPWRVLRSLCSASKTSGNPTPKLSPASLLKSLDAILRAPQDEKRLGLRISATLGHYYSERERHPGEWAFQIGDWMAVLEGIPVDVVEIAVQAWLRGKDARYKPLPGAIRDLCLKEIAEVRAAIIAMDRPWMALGRTVVDEILSDMDESQIAEIMAEPQGAGLSSSEGRIRVAWVVQNSDAPEHKKRPRATASMETRAAIWEMHKARMAEKAAQEAAEPAPPLRPSANVGASLLKIREGWG